MSNFIHYHKHDLFISEYDHSSLTLNYVFQMKCTCYAIISTKTETIYHKNTNKNILGFDRVDLQRTFKNYGSLYLACNDRKAFSLPLTKVGIHFGHVRMCATPCPISLIIFILDLGPSYTDKLLEFRWVQIAHLS